ncbi:MAG TPA: glycosyltransferase [Flavobacterium sp.]|jgi:glycosyltransferase involved in cell wall biosynthesis
MRNNIDKLISIIIPTFNRGYIIHETLDSIINQTYKNWECIIVDDGSTDTTAEIINSYIEKDPRFKYFLRPEYLKKGPNSCRNFGFMKSKGDFIKWFDSDDVLLPNALLMQSEIITEKTDAVVSKIIFADFEKKLDMKLSKISSPNLIADYLGGKVAFFISGPLWKRAFIEKQSELFDANIRNMDDWDFNLRMLYQNPNIVFDDRPILRYRIHASSLSHEINWMNYSEIDSEILALEKHLVIVKSNGDSSQKKSLLTWMKGRFNYYLRTSLVESSNRSLYFFKKLIIVQLQLFDLIGVSKAFTGYLSYITFKKGYSLFK